MRTLFSSLRIVTLAGAALGMTACDNPCVALGHEICDCETSESAQQSCRTTVDDRAKEENVTTAEEKRCSELLDSCSCKKLAVGDLAACGLSEP